MKKIEAIIERASDGTYSVYCTNEMFSGMGDSAEAAKADMIEQMKFFKNAAIEDGSQYPSWMDDEYEIVYKFEVASLLEYYSGILSLFGLKKITGIHQKQLWNYLHRKAKPRPAQVNRIEKALHAFGSELQSVSL